MEDALEAIIGAIYIDSDIYSAKKCITQWYKIFIENINKKNNNIKDAKSKLQEYLQNKIQSIPKYCVKKISGSEHNKIFQIELSLGILKKKYHGQGTSIKKAEHAAAIKALKSLENMKNYEK